MSIKSVAHVCIKTTNFDATTHFYCDALGRKKMFNFVKQGKVIGFYMKRRRTTLSLRCFMPMKSKRWTSRSLLISVWKATPWKP